MLSVFNRNIEKQVKKNVPCSMQPWKREQCAKRFWHYNFFLRIFSSNNSNSFSLSLSLSLSIKLYEIYNSIRNSSWYSDKSNCIRRRRKTIFSFPLIFNCFHSLAYIVGRRFVSGLCGTSTVDIHRVTRERIRNIYHK